MLSSVQSTDSWYAGCRLSCRCLKICFKYTSLELRIPNCELDPKKRNIEYFENILIFVFWPFLKTSVSWENKLCFIKRQSTIRGIWTRASPVVGLILLSLLSSVCPTLSVICEQKNIITNYSILLKDFCGVFYLPVKLIFLFSSELS